MKELAGFCSVFLLLLFNKTLTCTDNRERILRAAGSRAVKGGNYLESLQKQ